MSTKKIMFAILGVFVASAVAFGALGMSSVSAADEQSETGFTAFTTRVAELLGVEQTEVASAIEQAHEEGFGRGMGKKGPQGMHSDLAICIDVEPEELMEAMKSADGQTMEELLTSLGVDDLESVEQCVLEAKDTHFQEMIDSGRITEEEAAEKQAWMEEERGDFLDHEIGSMKGSGRGRGHGRGMGNGGNGAASESGVQ